MAHNLALPSSVENVQEQSGVRALDIREPLIYGFDYPHKIGSICASPCAQCGEKPGEFGVLSDREGNRIPPQPLFILREATYEEYLAQVSGDNPAMPENGLHYYAESVD